MVEIRDIVDLQKWLETMPREVSGIIAARIALRVLPLTLDYIRRKPEEQRAAMLLPTLRAMALPWVAAVGSAQGQQKVNSAAYAAYAATRATSDNTSAAAAYAAATTTRATSDATSATVAALNAANHASDAAASEVAAADSATASDVEFMDHHLSSVWLRLFQQSKTRDACKSLANMPLWPEAVPKELTEAWHGLRSILADAADEDWEVWTGWYEDRLAGNRPVNMDLELERILIPDDDWQKGPSHVNGIIRGLIEKYNPPEEQLERKLPQRSLARLDDTGVITVEVVEIDGEAVYQRVCDQVQDSLTRFPESSLSNIYSELSDPVELLSQALEERRDVPITIHRRIVQAAREVNRLMIARDYLREDFKVQTLKEDLDNAIQKIPDAVPAVREEIASRAEVNIRAIESSDIARIRDAKELIADVAEEPVVEIIEPGLSVLDKHQQGEMLSDETEREHVYALGWMLFSIGRLGKQLDELRARLVDGADQIGKLSVAIIAASQLYQLLLRIFL